MSDMKHSGSLVVEGYGHMGAIHAKIASSFGLDVSCVSGRKDVPFKTWQTTRQAIQNCSPDYYIISNKTSDHHKTLACLSDLDFRGHVLVEKPLCLHPDDLSATYPFKLSVGYNLRFHPVIEKLSEILKREKLSSARFSVGGHISRWRPGTTLSKSYSMRRAEGGGVLRDLSHELDLALLFCGRPKTMHAIIGNWSIPEMDCESIADIIYEGTKCSSVNIHLDCCDRNPHRFISIQTHVYSIAANLPECTLVINGERIIFPYSQWESLEKQMSAFIRGESNRICSLEEAKDVSRIIERIESQDKM